VLKQTVDWVFKDSYPASRRCVCSRPRSSSGG